jgi:hypothetical protein
MITAAVYSPSKSASSIAHLSSFFRSKKKVAAAEVDASTATVDPWLLTTGHLVWPARAGKPGAATSDVTVWLDTAALRSYATAGALQAMGVPGFVEGAATGSAAEVPLAVTVRPRYRGVPLQVEGTPAATLPPEPLSPLTFEAPFSVLSATGHLSASPVLVLGQDILLQIGHPAAELFRTLLLQPFAYDAGEAPLPLLPAPAPPLTAPPAPVAEPPRLQVFTHPGILLDSEQIAFIREQVRVRVVF